MTQDRAGRIAVNHALAPAVMRAREFASAAKAAGAAGIGWTVQALDQEGPDELRRITAGSGLFVSTLNSAGFFLQGDPDDAEAQRSLNLGLLDAAATLQARSLVVVTGGIAEFAASVSGAHARAVDALGALAEQAASRGIRLALKPIHPIGILEEGCINSIQHALRVLRDLPGVDMVADCYHSAWDPDLPHLPRLAPGRVPVLQLCNWAAPDTGRIPVRELPELGYADNPELLRRWREAGWTGIAEFTMHDQDRRGRSVAALLSQAVQQIERML